MFFNPKAIMFLIGITPVICGAADHTKEGEEYINLLSGFSLTPVAPHTQTRSLKLSYSSDDETTISTIPHISQYESYKIFSKGQEDYRKNIKNVGYVRNEVESLLTLYAAEKICLVYDVDGTMTNQEDPTRLTSNTNVTPRGSIQSDVDWYKSQGCKYVFSSAWHKFEETIERLVKIDALVEGQEVSNFSAFNIEHYLFKGFVHGNTASFTQNYGAECYYRNKSVSPLGVYADSFEEIEVLILVEDSPRNIAIFLDDISTFNPYPNLNKVIVFGLEAPYMEEDK